MSSTKYTRRLPRRVADTSGTVRPAVLPPPVQPCVEGFLFVRAPPTFLLLKRSPTRGGFWQSVSGRFEPSDASFADAVLREVEEETGFTEIVSLVDLRWELIFPGKDGRPWHVHSFGVELPERRPPRLSSEHVSYRWCRPGEALSTLFWPDNREALRRLSLMVAH